MSELTVELEDRNASVMVSVTAYDQENEPTPGVLCSEKELFQEGSDPRKTLV